MSKNEMDKKNYGKKRLLESLKKLSEYIEDKESYDLLDLHLTYIINELIEKTPFEYTKDKIQYCTYCHAIHKKHIVKFSNFHLNLLIKVFNYAVKNKTHIFNKKDLNLTKSEYGNFYQLQRFGLIYFDTDENGKRIKTGKWGIPLKRVAKFLKGEGQISEFYIRDTQKKKNIPSENKIKISEIPKTDKHFNNIVPDFVSYDKLGDN